MKAFVGLCYLFLLCFSLVFGVVQKKVDVRDGEYQRKFPSMILSNWKDLALTWSGPRDNPNDAEPIRATGITSLRLAPNWTANAISNETFVLQFGSTKYVDPRQWDGEVILETSGEFRTSIDLYDQNPLPFVLTKSYFVPPQQSFFFVRYHIENPTSEKQLTKFLDFVNTAPSECLENQTGLYDKQNSGFFLADLTRCGQNYFAMTSPCVFKQCSFTYQVGSKDGPDSPLTQFILNSSLAGNSKFTGAQVSIGVLVEIPLEPQSSQDIFVVRTLGKDEQTAIGSLRKATSKPVEYWLDQTSQAYNTFLKKGKQPPISGKLRGLYDTSVLLMKNSQNPTLGTFVASFHPAYQFKVWGRDAIFSAMIMDEAGYHQEAELYLQWMATAQLRENSQGFHTCYNFWSGEVFGFVEPQLDSVGAYITSVYHHYKLTNSTSFISNAIQTRVRQLEDFLLTKENDFGFIPPDYSIWEESSDPHTRQSYNTSYFTFTQSMASAGCFAASQLERLVWNNNQRADLLLKRSFEIAQAIENYLWLPDFGHYGRSVLTSPYGSVDNRVDGSSVAVIFMGVTTNKTRMVSHLQNVYANLTRLEHGIARYWNDVFFYDSVYNPGGKEVGAPSPPWGVTTMFVAWSERRVSNSSLVDRLQWMVDHAASGGTMPVGESIDGVTGQFVMSACPDLYEYGGVYMWTTLLQYGLAFPPDPRTWNYEK